MWLLFACLMVIRLSIKICRMAVSHLGENSEVTGMCFSGMPHQHHSTKDDGTAWESMERAALGQMAGSVKF